MRRLAFSTSFAVVPSRPAMSRTVWPAPRSVRISRSVSVSRPGVSGRSWPATWSTHRSSTDISASRPCEHGSMTSAPACRAQSRSAGLSDSYSRTRQACSDRSRTAPSQVSGESSDRASRTTSGGLSAHSAMRSSTVATCPTTSRSGRPARHVANVSRNRRRGERMAIRNGPSGASGESTPSSRDESADPIAGSARVAVWGNSHPSILPSPRRGVPPPKGFLRKVC